MQKRFVPFVLLFALILVAAAHLGGRLCESAPTFGYAAVRGETNGGSGVPAAHGADNNGGGKESQTAAQKRVFLTFDDGPSTVVTNRILDTLQEEGVQATFFIVSDRVDGREETLRRTVREGHTVGVHSATHRYGEIYASDGALLADAARCAETIARVTGVTPHVYRFPYGAGNARQAALMEKAGYRVVRWNAVCGDAEGDYSAERLLRRSIATAEGKDPVVLLLHDSAYRKTTAEALPDIIAWFREHGYAFCAF